MHASAEVLDFHSRQHSDPPTEAVLHELRAVRELLSAVERRLLGEAVPAEAAKRQAPVLNDDAVIDQRSVPAPRDLYLRLARAKAFSSNKVGKRILARWGDVRAAMLGGPSVRKTQSASGNGEPQVDGLDDLRRQLGLAQKDG